MTDPRRLIEQGATEFETALLEAGRRDAISEDGRRRVLSSLALGGGVLAGTAATGASAAAKTAPHAVLGGVFVKYIGIGGVAALAVWGGMKALYQVEATRARGPLVSQAAAAATPSGSPLVPAATAEVEGNDVAPVIEPASPPHTGATAPSGRRSRPADALSERSKDSLPKELSVLDSARRELASGNPTHALLLLEEYEGLFPNGRLGTEAAVLRIESLARAGDRANLAAAGKDFLAKHPNGPYATRVRSLIGETRRVAPDSPEGRR